ncbi:MAG: TRAP transporter small permease subunit [Hahellaceae bacterium]|nr:TRAP transporter small permease subunit [Hahellaceae bacterium]
MPNQDRCLTSDRHSSSLASLLYRLAAWSVLPLLVLIVLCDIVARSFFDTPLTWAHETLGFLLLAFFALSLPRTLADQQLITVDAIDFRKGSVGGRLSRIVIGFTAALVGIALLCMSGQAAWDMYRFQERAYTFAMPLWPVALLPGLAGGLILVGVMRQIARIKGPEVTENPS